MKHEYPSQAQPGDIAFANAVLWVTYKKGNTIKIPPGEVFTILYKGQESYRLLYDNKIVSFLNLEYLAIHKFDY